MPLLQINAGPEGPRLHNSDAALRPALEAALSTRGPVVIMVHGYKFAPGHARDCPHRHILSLTPRRSWKALSWPAGLGFGTGCADEGLAIGFGWSAMGTLWGAYGRAQGAAASLARLIALIERLSPGRPVQMIAHSLGARVVFGAMAQARAGHVGRVILLNGAEYAPMAQQALAAPAGAGAELIHVTSRENDPYDFLFERLIRPPCPGARSLTEGFPAAPNTLMLQLDQTGTRTALSGLGFELGPQTARICHWSAYLRPGLLPLYAALLRRPGTLSLSLLRDRLPRQTDPRWSRLAPDLRRPWARQPGQAWLSTGGTTSSTMNQ